MADSSVKDFEVDVRKISKLLGAGSKEFRKAVSEALTKAGLILEDEASERCPKYTGQLSLTIGHFRVDPETSKLAKEAYGEAADPSTAIFRKPAWNIQEIGTSVEYAQWVHQRSPFLTDAAAAKAGEIHEVITKTIQRRMKKFFKF